MARTLVSALLVIAIAALAGCASAPIATEQLDQAAKSFATKPGKANIYVYRNEHFGAAVSMDVQLNGKSMGKTGPMTYFLFEVPTGKHTVTSKAENDVSVDLTVEAGKNYFLWQEVKMGVMYAR